MQRDYFKDPLKYGEKIPYDDLYEMYIVQNTPKGELHKIFNCTHSKVKSSMKFYKIKKSMELRQQCHTNTMIKKYGVKNIFEKTDFIKQKVHEKYGVDNIMQTEQAKEKFRNTCMERYGVAHVNKTEEFKNKLKATNQRKYGGNAPMCSPEIQEKTRKTNLERYGETSPLKNNKIKEKMLNTRIEKYGTTNTYMAPDAKEHYIQTSQNKYGTNSPNQNQQKKEKCKQTCLERYGVEYSLQSKKVKQKTKETLLEKYGVEHIMQLPETHEKIRQTMRKNDSYRKSKAEEYVYAKLQEKFTHIERQYGDDRYPFKCDFYIPELDLFIEYQGYQGHGKHPYNPNNPDDKRLVEEWQQGYQEINKLGKRKGQYKDYIEIWTKSDPLKRQTAKQNNLNWIEFFSLKEFEEWFRQQ